MSRLIPSKSAARVLRPALACVPALLLAACGGGGGGSSASGPAPVAAVSITSANQQAVAADALSTGTNTSYANTGTALVTGVQVDAGAGTGASGPVLLASVARKLAQMAPAGGTLATGASVSETVNCTGGGTLSVSGNVASDTSLNAGDSMTMTAASCKDTVGGEAMTMNGTLKIEITSGTFTSGSLVYPQHVAMKLTATNLSIATATETDALNGDLTVDLTVNSNIAESETLSGTALAFTATTASGKSGFSLKNYSESYSVNGGTETFAINETVETSNSRLGNVSYTISTPASSPIVKANGVYKSGSVKVTGNQSALQITVTADDTFQLQLDSNGDGTWDATTTKTLAQLQQ